MVRGVHVQRGRRGREGGLSAVLRVLCIPLPACAAVSRLAWAQKRRRAEAATEAGRARCAVPAARAAMLCRPAWFCRRRLHERPGHATCTGLARCGTGLKVHPPKKQLPARGCQQNSTQSMRCGARPDADVQPRQLNGRPIHKRDTKGMLGQLGLHRESGLSVGAGMYAGACASTHWSCGPGSMPDCGTQAPKRTQIQRKGNGQSPQSADMPLMLSMHSSRSVPLFASITALIPP